MTEESPNGIIPIYIICSGLIVWLPVRKRLLRWYNSQVWLMAGENVVDIFIKRVAARLCFELFIWIVSLFVGALGGNLIVVLIGLNRIFKSNSSTQIEGTAFARDQELSDRLATQSEFSKENALDKLSALASLKEKGHLSPDEYTTLKKRILDQI